MKKLQPFRSPFEEIPSPIIWDIFSRLPTKTCLNCKLVCQDWYQIIISHEFGALRSSRSPFLTILLYGKFFSNRNNFLLLDLDRSSMVDEKGDFNVNPEAMIKFKSKFMIPHYKLYVVNECNGLVCLKSYKRWDPYIICNLLNGQEVIVEQVRKPSCTVECFGFGWCPISRLFKVVRLLKKGNFKSKAEVYTLGTNEWRTVGDAPLSVFYSSGAFLHGSLHRWAYNDSCIWSFHFGSEQFSNIPGPNGMNTRYLSNLSTFESCLSFCWVTESRFQCEIWAMKEYGVRDSWVKLFVFDTQFSAIRMPLLQVDEKEMLVSRDSGSSLEIADIKSGKRKQGRVLGISLFIVMMSNVVFSKLQVRN